MDEHGYTIHDAASTELEVCELLTAIVRVLKPQLVVETGAFRGYGTRALAAGCFRNGFGRVVSCEIDFDRVLEATERCIGMPAEIRHCRGADLPELRSADLVFLDSDYACRMEELDLVKPGAFVVVHDTRISYDGNLEPLGPALEARGALCFPTYRGLGILRSPPML